MDSSYRREAARALVTDRSLILIEFSPPECLPVVALWQVEWQIALAAQVRSVESSLSYGQRLIDSRRPSRGHPSNSNLSAVHTTVFGLGIGIWRGTFSSDLRVLKVRISDGLGLCLSSGGLATLCIAIIRWVSEGLS